MTVILPDNRPSRSRRDRWRNVDVAPTLVRAHRSVDEDAPQIDRPPALTVDRLGFSLLTVGMLALTVPLAVMVADENTEAASLRLLALALALTAFLAGAVFGIWALRQRTTIDRLRWPAFHRRVWGGWWSVVWMITPLVALVTFSEIEARTDGLVWTTSVLVGLVAVRMMSLRALGTNMKRVVFDARRWTRGGAVATAVADFLLVVVVWAALLEPQVDRDVLEVAASIVPLVVLLAAMFSLSYAKRVERWVIEWWDNRWGFRERDVLGHLFVQRAPGGEPREFDGRRLLPTAPLRMLVVASYTVLAATTAWAGWTVWTQRDALDGADVTIASIGRLEEASLWFVAALALMQVSHAAWYVGQAWNARRCTLAAPGATGTAILFLLAPSIMAIDVIWVDDDMLFALIAGIAVFVNLASWALSFSLLSHMLETLGRPTSRIGPWGTIVALQWVLLSGVNMVVLVDDTSVFAAVALAVASAGALIFISAAVYAQLAMRDVERATHDFDQVRRQRTSRRRRRTRGPHAGRAGVAPLSASQH